MIYVTTNTGEGFRAETYPDIVRMMIASERLRRRKRLATYMNATAERCRVWRGSSINTESAELFLQSLAREGFIILETDE